MQLLFPILYYYVIVLLGTKGGLFELSSDFKPQFNNFMNAFTFC